MVVSLELYSYTEENEFPLNKASFDTLLAKHCEFKLFYF